MGMKNLAVSIPEPAYEKIYAYASKSGRTVSDFLRDTIRATVPNVGNLERRPPRKRRVCRKA